MKLQLSRRRFIEAGAVVSVLPLAGQARWPEQPLAVVDARHCEALSFAFHYRNSGGSIQLAGDDAAPLWFERLAPVVASSRTPLVGLTRSSTLFCLEQLAWGQGMRVVLHAELTADGNGPIVHRNEARISFAAVDTAGAQWPKALAAGLSHCSRPVLRPGPSAVAEPAQFDVNDTTLHAWALARCGAAGATA